MMSVELFQKVIEQVAPMTEQVTLHLMGDPLVHPRLPEFIKICSEYRVPVFFVTNGILMNTAKEEVLLDPIIRQVNFSLHSFHDNYPNKDPGIYLDKIFRFTSRAFSERPDLYINFRLWNLSEPLGAGMQNRSMLERIENQYDLTLNDTVDVQRNKSIKILNRLYLHFDTEFTWPTLDLPSLGEKGTCYGLSSHFGVLADGTVVPCCLDKEGKIPLGNIQNESVREILQNSRAQKILSGFRNHKLEEALCQRCNYIKRFGS